MAGERTNKVVFIIAHERFRDEEYFEPKAVLEEADYEVVTASSYLTPASGKLGGTAEVDVIFSEINVDNYDAIVFVGGPGVVTYWDDWRAQALGRLFKDNDKPVCAICSAPVILARAGLLEGKKATSFPGDRESMEKEGVEYSEGPLEYDFGILTGNGPDAAYDFGKAIVRLLKDGDPGIE